MENLSVQNCHFSEDVIFKEILPKVPTKSVIRFKSVSKSWLARITGDSTFIADHAAGRSTPTDHCCIMQPRNYYKRFAFRFLFLGHGGALKPVEIDTAYIREALLNTPQELNFMVQVVGSCNGLVCLRLWGIEETVKLVIWNPVTREFKYLPQPTLPPLPEGFSWQNREDEYYFGVGKVDINDYKVVRLEHSKSRYWNEEIVIDVQLYTKSRGRWRQLNSFSGFVVSYGRVQGVTVDGIMHWMIRRADRNCNPIYGVLSLDLCTEEFQEFEAPIWNRDCSDLGLIKWKGCLGAFLVMPYRTEYDIWLRTKDNHTNYFCWTKMASLRSSLWPVYFGGILGDRFFLQRENSRKRFLYDVTSHEMEELEEEGSDVIYVVFEHVHTLISPN